VRFLRVHAAEYHLDPARIAVAGGSAGGHLSLMVGFTAGKKELEPEAPYPGVSSAVRAIIDMYGIANLSVHGQSDAKGEPTATRKLMNNSLTAFGAANDEAELFRTASPVSYVTKGAPPVLILHGNADTTVDYAQSEELVRAAKARGVEHEFVLLDGIGHTFDWETWNKKPLPRDLRPLALAFLAKHLAPATH
jgi:acetyl esterase/lipase